MVDVRAVSVRVSSEAVASASQRVAAMVEEFAARRALCTQTVSALVGGPWTGQASTTFHEGYSEWASGAAEVSEALQAITTLLAAASAQYAETEANVTAVSQTSTVVSATPAVGSASSHGRSGGAR